MSANRIVAIPAALMLTACACLPHAHKTGDQPPRTVPTEIAWNSLQCPLGESRAARHFADQAALARAEPELARQLPTAIEPAGAVLLDMGRRPTGGYRLDPARTATIADGRYTVAVERVAPDPQRLVTQAFTRPCLILQLPDAEFHEVRIIDQQGAAWAEVTLD